MKGNRYVQSRIFLKELFINCFFFFKKRRKKKPEGAEATEAKQETLSVCKGSILQFFKRLIEIMV